MPHQPAIHEHKSPHLSPTRLVRGAVILLGVVLGFLFVIWLVSVILLTNPKTATPVINWGLDTFGAKPAQVESGRLKGPFSTTFNITAINWPERINARELDVTVNPWGWLPGQPWASRIHAADGQVTLKSSGGKKTSFNPQKYVDRIDITDMKLNFTRRGKPKEVTILAAAGSFAKGNVSAEAITGDNRLSFDGLAKIGVSSNLGGVVKARGQNLKDLAEVVGASAPDTPPFDIAGRLVMENREWKVEQITGRMGDSDISGAVAVKLGGEKPFLNVDLASKELDFDDLAIVFGLPAKLGKSETTNEEQRVAKAKFDASSRLIPDTRIDFARLKAVNADINFHATKVVDAPWGVNAIKVVGTLRDQRLNLTDVAVSTPEGGLFAKVDLDATRDPALTKTTGTLKGVSLQRVLGTKLLKGSANGAFNLALTGSGFREAFGSANGEVGVWSSNSELAKIATEAAGLDVGEVLLRLKDLNGDPAYFKSRCLAANVKFRNGVGTLDPAVLDNEDTLIVAKGGLNLQNETLDVKVEGHAKDFSIGKVFGDIGVKGTMRKPNISALSSKTLLQAGLTALLSSIAGPLGALPFVETGGADDAPCTALVSEAKAAGTAEAKPAKVKARAS